MLFVRSRTAVLDSSIAKSNPASHGSLFDRYSEAATRRALSAYDEFQWCLRCGSGQLHCGNDPRFVCCECGYEQCVHHGLPWHSGVTCEDFDRRQSEEKLNLETISRTTKKCPGAGCGVNIEKNEGCSHMTCKCFPPPPFTHPSPLFPSGPKYFFPSGWVHHSNSRQNR